MLIAFQCLWIFKIKVLQAKACLEIFFGREVGKRAGINSTQQHYQVSYIQSYNRQIKMLLRISQPLTLKYVRFFDACENKLNVFTVLAFLTVLVYKSILKEVLYTLKTLLGNLNYFIKPKMKLKFRHTSTCNTYQNIRQSISLGCVSINQRRSQKDVFHKFF